jgi:hypothetical protein
MRRAAKVDGNQAEIVDALRAHGACVVSLAPVGAGIPDLLVGWRGFNILMEVKDGSLAPSARRLTSVQRGWHSWWKGTAHIVTSVEDALFILKSGKYL